MSELHISLTAEKLFRITDNFWITNSLLTSWISILFLFFFAVITTKKIRKIPDNLQQIGEIVVDGIHALFAGILPDKINVFYPILATYFLYIISLNWLGLLPGVGTIGINLVEEGHKVFVPLLRAGTADINTTLGLALTSIVVIQFAGIQSLGAGYLKKYFNFGNPINFFVGILELASEFSKILSFTFRLFGNIFAGEVLLTVIAFLVPVLAPIPFMGLELFVGFIQALVFSMLTTVFLSLAVVKTEH